MTNFTPDGLPPLRDVIAEHGLGARKTLGQHFLLDLNVTRKIVRSLSIDAHETVLEVGPGPGGLTRALLESGVSVTAVERDKRCITALKDVALAYPDRLTLIEDDALQYDEISAFIRKPIIIASNLPYNISTELLLKWLRANHQFPQPLWRRMALMFQKEVADRILASPGTKAYGRLSVISQIASMPRKGFDLPARAFTPPPKVDSTVVLFDATANRIEHLQVIESITQSAFSQRRKMLRSSLKPVFGTRVEDVLASVGISETVRAEELTPQQYLDLSAIKVAKS